MEFNWTVSDMFRNASTGVVEYVDLIYTVKSEYGTSFYLTTTSSLPSISPTASNFIPYNELTEPIVLSWVTGSLPQSEYETQLSSSVARLFKSNTQIEGEVDGLPW
jgi:hypothetical protein